MTQNNNQRVESLDQQRQREQAGEPSDPEALQDARLLAAVAEGDQQALAALYRRHGSLIYSLLVRMLGNTPEAQEATQDTFLKIWRRAQHYRPERSTPGAWMVMLARGLALDRLRARSRSSAHQAAYESELALLEVQVNEARPLERDELALACVSALHQLPEPQGQALQLAFLRGWTHEEIARATNEPLGTVKARIRRGLLTLRTILRDYHA